MAEQKNKELLEKDLYKLFDVEEASTLEEIRKAYRKKALELHPDKNLDNKEEAEKRFIELKQAFEILTDKGARSAYDAVRRQKKEKVKRDEQLDDKRRKLKQDLERREEAAKEKAEKQMNELRKSKVEENFKAQIERLRREGNKMVEEEMELINQQIRLEKKRNLDEKQKEVHKPGLTSANNRIKISWSSKLDEKEIKYDEDILRHIFSKYGEIDILVMSKKSSAIIEYKNDSDSVKCLNDEASLSKKYKLALTSLKVDQQPKTNDSPNLANVDSQPAPNPIHQSMSFEEMEMAILKKLKSAASS